MPKDKNDKRGLASADEETRQRVAHEGGKARSEQTDMSELGSKGGESTAETHGEEFYSEIGRKGGQSRVQDEDVKSGELGRMGGQASRGGRRMDEDEEEE